MLIFDPWLDPMPLPSVEPLGEDHNSLEGVYFEDAMKRKVSLPRLLVINSEKFTLWKEPLTAGEHCEVLSADGSLLTLGVFQFPSYSFKTIYDSFLVPRGMNRFLISLSCLGFGQDQRGIHDEHFATL